MPHTWRSLTTANAASSSPWLIRRTPRAGLDFELMQGGGAIKGWRVGGKACDAVMARLNTLFDGSDVQIVIGDGNHSLAAAKDYWDELQTFA